MPLLDAYQAPYKAKNRYWTGLLLLVRAISFVVLAINSQGSPNKNLFVLALVTLLLFFILTISGGVYRNWGLNALELSMVLNLGILIVATLYNMQVGR